MHVDIVVAIVAMIGVAIGAVIVVSNSTLIRMLINVDIAVVIADPALFRLMAVHILMLAVQSMILKP